MGDKREDFPLQNYYADIYKSYDRVNRIFTFGRDRHWRKKAAAECLNSDPEQVLDLCTGTGDFIIELAQMARGNIQLTGYDFSPDMLEVARTKYARISEQKEIPTLAFLEGDVGKMPFEDQRFHAIGIHLASETWCMKIQMLPGTFLKFKGFCVREENWSYLKAVVPITVYGDSLIPFTCN